jgi:hypothetical protein
MISASVRYEKQFQQFQQLQQFQQFQGKHIAPHRVGRAVSRWMDPLEDGGVL